MAVTAGVSRPGMLVGARVKRVNDPKLLTGAGRYVDDLRLPGMVYARVLRSQIAHGRVVGVDTSRARAHPDVIDILTPDVAAKATSPMPCVWVMPEQRQVSYPVISDHVLYVGQPLGVVVTRTRAAAEDAAELVELEIEELPAVADAESAVAEGAPLLHPEWGTNVAVEMTKGEPREVVEAALARSPHVVAMRFKVQRQAGSPMEPRGLVARWDPVLGDLTVWLSTQVPHHARDVLADCLGLGYDHVRIIALDVGGGFGPKDHLYPDEVLVCLAAMRSGAPVKWVEDRRESFVATVHAREQLHHARLGFDETGRFIAIHTELLGDIGAHPSNVGAGPAFVCGVMLEGPYRFESAGATIRCALTNKTPTGAYRGFGMQQAAWVRERLVDEAARTLGMDPAEIRRRNMLRRDELPYMNHAYQNYDSGDYAAALERAAELIRQAPPPPDDGKRRGIGLSCYVEFTGLGPSAVNQIVGFHLGGYETAVVRMEPDGKVAVLTGVCPHGQGLETTLAQLAADRLGVALEDVRVLFGDTASAPYSSAGTIASRSMAVGGGAVVRASERVRAKLLEIAGNVLEASAEDLEIADGSIRVRGTPARALTVREVAERAWLGWDLPRGMQPGLEERDLHDPADISYSYATHAAAVAVDPETGRIEVERYVVVHDCGVVVNPMIVEGQIHGGVAQGLGGALQEEVVYDRAGQPLAASFLDYALPTAGIVPSMHLDHLETPSPFIPGGMKGMGEGGTIAPPAAIGNALANAVPEIAGRVGELPLSPSRVWSWLKQAQAAGGQQA